MQYNSRQSISSAEWHYSNIECGAQGILHRLERFHHDCFVREVCVITDHKLLVAILNKDVAIVSPQLQCIVVCIHHYRVCIICKPGQGLYIADLLSRNNHTGNKDQEITVMDKNVNAISITANMPVCPSIEDIKMATHEDAYLQKQKLYKMIH